MSPGSVSVAATDPAVGEVARARLAGEAPDPEALAASPLVQALSRDHGLHPYAKWRGAFWRPDGGWNCDRRPEATHSSFHESWAPIRGLWAYGEREAARRGAEFLLRHRVYCSERTGLRLEHLTRLRWASYWHYDTLVLSKRRPDGTWRAEGRWWKRPGSKGSNVEAVDWGSTANELLTIACLAVL